MGTHINFNNLGGGGDPGGEGFNQMKPTDSAYPLARQSSLYSLTFDELQTTLLGGPGKDLGSMNMDELLKSIWTAEESQAMAMTMTSSAQATAVTQQPGGGGGGGNLQRQGSLTLPRTISQKTVDEVWKFLITKDEGGSSGGGGGESNAPQRQQTLGEMTLEEFLFRAGVVREDNNSSQQMGQVGNNNNSNGFYGNNGAPVGLGFEFGQQNHNSISFNNGANDSMILNQPPGLGLKVGGTMQQQQQLNQPHPQQQRVPQIIFPKQANFAFAAPGVTAAATSPGTSSAENNSLSPVDYVLNRGRRSNTGLEKVIERRQRRMIKNRESAARSRARKQAYTLELEAEIEKLKKANQELRRKQAEMVEMQKNELKESSKKPWGSKRQCLRRTLTGPW
ncbi:ABSCISIC ACID-INSENSITIVE 5-like protein 7 [Raphanus sativus]|uniref:ABSCISIC ACID-INSENSITIVE 5-like protein 7 isoform X2 n=1 Tax=Raphanus sativus TaxID=3726 RepID=A0A9W3DTW8_RAPSA|nr:ABSCISIC ACID-INSENSITIVE 5-like protein 7 isoform X2 [Raphanus sativus]KAJ4894019.1 ABSCISIC ACID-INSENSITIVE 5-like protein 7 [Raphanus sativus]